MHLYTEEQLGFLRDNAQSMSRQELTELFNRRFGLQLSPCAIIGTCKRYGIRGRETRFRSGQAPWNAGMQGSIKENATSFKPGNRPHNWLPVGTRIIDSDGYAKVKISEPNKWAFVHVLVWKERHGELPPGHVVIFADGNKANLSEDNVVAVSRAELAVLNKQHLLNNDTDISKAGILLAKIIIKAKERQRHGTGYTCRRGGSRRRKGE